MTLTENDVTTIATIVMMVAMCGLFTVCASYFASELYQDDRYRPDDHDDKNGGGHA